MNKELTILVDGITKVKQSKNGEPFIGVKSESGDWYNCWDERLFNIFNKGESYQVVVEENNGFKNIVDVISDGLGIVPKKQTKKEADQDKVLEDSKRIEETWKMVGWLVQEKKKELGGAKAVLEPEETLPF